jgi:hypothetical protein
MPARSQGGLHDASKLAAGLSVSAPTITIYADLLVDLLLVRKLPSVRAARRREMACRSRESRHCNDVKHEGYCALRYFRVGL